MEKELEQELTDFLKHIYLHCTDEYGNLQVCLTGDELDPTIERVVTEYLKSK
jgi:hypothetical protein